MRDKLKSAIISKEKAVREAIIQLNDNMLQFLLVVDEQSKLVGTVTDGDIRRSIINNISLDESVEKIMNQNPKFIYAGEEEKARQLMITHGIKTVPVLDESNNIIDLILMEDILDQTEIKEKYQLKTNTVFIMAGGKGTRLDPFTKILPKPLIPIGDKPIIEIIMDNLRKYGFNNFILSVNYKAEIIKLYFAENSNGYNLDYVQEKEFLGTAGSLKLAQDRLTETFVVSNCDVIIDMDFEKFINHHRKQKNSATIVGVVKHMQVPYGVIEARNGSVVQMIEKPRYDFIVNSGIYILEPEIIKLIPDNQPFNMPDLLLLAKENGFKIGVYPISTNWFDIGQWEEYQHTLEHFKKLDGIIY